MVAIVNAKRSAHKYPDLRWRLGRAVRGAQRDPGRADFLTRIRVRRRSQRLSSTLSELAMHYPPIRAAWLFVALALLLLAAFASAPASAFCGFYVGKADAKLFNEASQFILVRDGNRTVISMRNDFQGDLSEFALVVPVPVVLQKSQIHIGDPKTFERIDAYSAPRLAKYFDPNPCEVSKAQRQMGALNSAAPASMAKEQDRKDKALGVTVEARYTVGEYDIAILSATESNGLEKWLRLEGHKT